MMVLNGIGWGFFVSNRQTGVSYGNSKQDKTSNYIPYMISQNIFSIFIRINIKHFCYFTALEKFMMTILTFNY